LSLYLSEKPESPKGSKSKAKGELLKQRNLKRYINQVFHFCTF